MDQAHYQLKFYQFKRTQALKADAKYAWKEIRVLKAQAK